MLTGASLVNGSRILISYRQAARCSVFACRRHRSHNLVGCRARVPAVGLSDMCGRTPVFCERTSVGLDVHARSVAAAAIDGATGEVSGLA